MRQSRSLPTALALALAAVAGATLLPAALGPRYGGEVRITVPSVPSSLDPGEPRSAGHLLALGLVHDRLVDLDASGVIRPRLAASWEQASDQRQWLLTLRESRCHDDQMVTAETVVSSLRRFVRSDSAAGATMASSLEGGNEFRRRTSDDLPGVVAESGRQVRLRFTTVRSAPLAPLASWAAAITSLGGAPCGPFRVPVAPSAAAGGTLVFVASSGHWAGRPFLDGVLLTSSSSGAPVPAEAAGDDVATVVFGSGDPLGPPQRLVLWLETRQGPFAERAARRALAACDWSRLAQGFLPGGSPLAGLATDAAPLRSSTAACAPTPDASHRNDVTLVVASDVAPLASQRVVAQMLALRHDPHVVVVAPDALMSSEGDAHLGFWLPDVQRPSLIVGEAASIAGLSGIERAAEAAAAVEDPDARLAAVRAAEGDLLADGAGIPLALAPLRATLDRRLRDAVIDEGGRFELENAWLVP